MLQQLKVVLRLTLSHEIVWQDDRAGLDLVALATSQSFAALLTALA
jgi:hypothetical protein